jgi:hypothetical protein
MIVVAGGDSFVYGSELADQMRDHTVSQYTFTALLSKDYEYKCVAVPGFGNDSIARTVIENCQQLHRQKLFVIVSWTFPGRYEFRFNYNTGQRTGNWYTITPWTTESVETIKKEYVNQDYWVELHHQQHLERAKKTGVADFAKTFYQHVGNSEYWEIYSTLKEIVYLQNYLKVNNIPYLFTCADSIIFYNQTLKNADDTLYSLFKQIDRKKWFLFEPGSGPDQTQAPRGFYQWAVENKYPIATTHPLEEAHQEAANLIQGKFNEMVKESVQ